MGGDGEGERWTFCSTCRDTDGGEDEKCESDFSVKATGSGVALVEVYREDSTGASFHQEPVE